MRGAPPPFSTWVLRRVLPPDEIGAAIFGDLLEELDASGHTRAARRRFARHAWSITVRYALRRAPRTGRLATRQGGGMGREIAILGMRHTDQAADIGVGAIHVRTPALQMLACLVSS